MNNATQMEATTVNIINLLANSTGWNILLEDGNWYPLPLTTGCHESEAVEFVKNLPLAKDARAIRVTHRS